MGNKPRTPAKASDARQAEALSEALGRAVRDGRADKVRRLLTEGADPNRSTPGAPKPLEVAIHTEIRRREGSLRAWGVKVAGEWDECARLLLKAEADPLAKSKLRSKSLLALVAGMKASTMLDPLLWATACGPDRRAAANAIAEAVHAMAQEEPSCAQLARIASLREPDLEDWRLVEVAFNQFLVGSKQKGSKWRKSQVAGAKREACVEAILDTSALGGDSGLLALRAALVDAPPLPGFKDMVERVIVNREAALIRGHIDAGKAAPTKSNRARL